MYFLRDIHDIYHVLKQLLHSLHNSVCGCLLSNYDISFPSVSIWEDHGEPLNSEGFVIVLSCFCFISF